MWLPSCKEKVIEAMHGSELSNVLFPFQDTQGHSNVKVKEEHDIFDSSLPIIPLITFYFWLECVDEYFSHELLLLRLCTERVLLCKYVYIYGY